MLRSTLTIAFTALLVACTHQPAHAREALIGDQVPKTDKAFRNNPEHFQFLVVGDRTGAARPGVFERAIDAINLLQPEFVLSVGDLIEGYTEDKDQLVREWEEVDAMIDKLQMPFFYTQGNHDSSNQVMRELWKRRYGAEYYHFRYRDVLFLSLSTEDPPIVFDEELLARQAAIAEAMVRDPDQTQKMILQRRPDGPVELPQQRAAISNEQLRYVEQALLQNADARWTFLLMHKPVWTYESGAFAEIEEMLSGRSYTAIAGHNHYYDYGERNHSDHIVMSTTGGVWLSGGPGSFDHLLWVTMAQQGPVFANIALDGVLDKRGRGSASD